MRQVPKTALVLMAGLLLGAAVGGGMLARPTDGDQGSPLAQLSGTRRALEARDEGRILEELGPELGRTWIEQHSLGVSKRLGPEDLEYYRARGTHEAFLLGWIAEYGIVSEEAEALRSIGLDLAVEQPADAGTPFHSAAFADVVVLGEISKVIGNPAGPYHSHYQLQADRYLKNCTNGAPPTIEGRLLETGPFLHEDHIHHSDFMAEPNLEEGERVILFLSRHPFNLIGKLQAPGSEAEIEYLERHYGPLDELLSFIEAPVGFEIIDANKVVGENAVSKLRALHVDTGHEVVDLNTLEQRIRQIANAQGPYCSRREPQGW